MIQQNQHQLFGGNERRIADAAGPVECLELTFQSDEARQDLAKLDNDHHRITSSALNLSGETTSAGLLFLPDRSVNGNGTKTTDPLGQAPEANQANLLRRLRRALIAAFAKSNLLSEDERSGN